MYAIINHDGHQRRVTPGEIVWLEKQRAEVGDTIAIGNVLLVNDGAATAVGTPMVEGASVEAVVLRKVRDRKVTILKYKRRKGYVRKKGHRHEYVEARITDIVGPGGAALAAAEEKKEEEAKPEDAPEETAEADETAPEADGDGQTEAESDSDTDGETETEE